MPLEELPGWQSLPEALQQRLKHFEMHYNQARTEVPGGSEASLFPTLVERVIFLAQHPHHFAPFHEAVRFPFDYHQFGRDFIRPFMSARSSVQGQKSIQQIERQLNQQDNVILFANHQTEPDPQILSLLLEPIAPRLAANIIFVAGDRVTSDPVAVPLSMGCNLLCIYSKKHIDHPPSARSAKMRHNQTTIRKMKELLDEGGKCIFVAPSGGRDRANALGKIEVAPLDPNSIELFVMIGQQTQHPTHFYPLALSTYHLMPPPALVEQEIGEERLIHFASVHCSFGQELPLRTTAHSGSKSAQREARRDAVWSAIHNIYATLQE